VWYRRTSSCGPPIGSLVRDDGGQQNSSSVFEGLLHDPAVTGVELSWLGEKGPL
jgi:hypothetical protein